MLFALHIFQTVKNQQQMSTAKKEQATLTSDAFRKPSQ